MRRYSNKSYINRYEITDENISQNECNEGYIIKSNKKRDGTPKIRPQQSEWDKNKEEEETRIYVVSQRIERCNDPKIQSQEKVVL